MKEENEVTKTQPTLTAEGGLQVFTHFGEKPLNETEIDESTEKNFKLPGTGWFDPKGNLETKSINDETWESNHVLITKAIHELMRDNGRIPTKNEIAIKTGLSRPTVYNHLKGFANNPQFEEQEEQLQIIASNVMAKVYEHAMYGDARAARLYFELTGKLNGK